ncbi:uncharacterized conserved protein [Longilinea arvoryzae]|uniref:Uncharacterized conserved protein n=1 Tax=Longilinea arvoryzae TaxID=360412 RepID=A0A0S7BEY5_9CHLR|nr:DUF711 family protein [Longilinea arvoryzae]GAP14041.1 uncharacterized conserved protein [Longilinea arvoryzae]
MKVRSITCFYHPGQRDADVTLNRLARLAQAVSQRFIAAGYEVETTRLATVPFPHMVPSCCNESAILLAQNMEKQASDLGFSYLSLGPALPQYPDSYRLIPQMIAATQNVFFGGVMATAAEGIHLPAVRACAEVIHAAAQITPDGFANLRFSALANVAPGAPFFPAGHAGGDLPAFALALECADTAIQAFSRASTLEEARNNLLADLEKAIAKLTEIAAGAAAEFEILFKGFDISLAPYPDDSVSLGGAMEKLGLPALGLAGSLAAAAFVADTLDRGRWPRTGFNGLMLPVLEDSVLAQRTIDGTLGVKDLLMFSAVCGTGLDTVPLPGDVTADQLAALLLDVASLAVRLGKPLTARLMPVPGKRAGDLTNFDFSYFANGRILSLDAAPLTGFFGGNETYQLHPRKPNGSM